MTRRQQVVQFVNGLEQQGAEHDSLTVAPQTDSQVRNAPTLAVAVAMVQRTDSDPHNSHPIVFASSENEDHVGESCADYTADDAGVEYDDPGEGTGTVDSHEPTERKRVQQVRMHVYACFDGVVLQMFLQSTDGGARKGD